MNEEIKYTKLHNWHAEHGGRIVPFADWELPVKYPSGPIQTPAYRR